MNRATSVNSAIRVSYNIVFFQPCLINPNPNPSPNPNPYTIPVEVPPDAITGVKWLKMSNNVDHWGAQYQRYVVCLGRAHGLYPCRSVCSPWFLRPIACVQFLKRLDWAGHADCIPAGQPVHQALVAISRVRCLTPLQLETLFGDKMTWI